MADTRDSHNGLDCPQDVIDSETRHSWYINPVESSTNSHSSFLLMIHIIIDPTNRNPTAT